ncbi:MAG: hypothetical protein QMC83_09110 [Thermodesulfovibrionales bacterium]|nr:hypothetical protein [Thermodesulfovibrionales bacterium]
MLLSAQKLKNKILKDRYNSIIFEKGRGKDLYLVGGYVRDVLRGVISQDRDYIFIGNARSFVNEIRKIIGGTVVKFKKGEMIRLALKDGVTFDFSRPMGTLEEDLSKRDFTINAIAWSPDTGIIDPYEGLKDIKNRKIRSLSDKNLTADPLRMFRAYRFAAELNGSIEEGTRKAIKMLHNRIKKVSPERITFEIFNLLNSEHPAMYLNMALSDGLLNAILSISDKTLGRNVKAISRLEAKINKLPLKLKVLLEKIFSQNLTYKGLLHLELLLRQDGSFVPDRIPKIRMSNNIIKRIMLTHKGIKEFKRDKLFDTFLKSKGAAMDILILKGRLDLLKEYERFKMIWKKGLLSSEEVSSVTGVKAGPKLGRIITELKKAQFEGRLRSGSDTVRFLLQYYFT